MGLQRSPVQKFGGLNTVIPPYDLPGGEASDALNVRYPANETDQETILRRGGLLNVTTGGFTGGAPVSTRPFDDGVDSLFIVLMSGDGDVWTAGPDLASAPTITRRIDGGAYTGRWAITNHKVSGITETFYGGYRDSQAAIPALANWAWDGVGAAIAWVNGYAGASQLIRSIVSWRGRLVVLGLDSNRVYYTGVGTVNDLTNTIDIFDGTGSSNRELLVHNNNLYLIKEDSVWMIYDPNTFANRLIANVGSGSDHRRISFSCPADKRMYWVNALHGTIYSSNGETDLVKENSAAPLPAGRLDLSTSDPFVYNSRCQLSYDPVQKTIVVNWQTVPTAGTDCDRLDEIYVGIGSPGKHPILRHAINTQMLVSSRLRTPLAGIGGRRPALLASSSKFLPAVFECFGNQTDDGTGIANAYWRGGWMPMLSEEPWERIRRVNLLYRGPVKVEVFSEMSLLDNVNAVAAKTFTPVDNSGTLPALQRQFVTSNGPNKKGRYHQVRVSQATAAGAFPAFEVSGLEFAIRGGKDKK